MKHLIIYVLSLLITLPTIAQQEKTNLPWIDLFSQKERQLTDETDAILR